MTTRDDLVSERLRKAVSAGMDYAGTTPAKSAVKVRPQDWHAICDAAKEAVSNIEAKDAEIASAQKCCDSYADENQRLSDRITALERQLAEETERCVGYLVKLRETHLAKAKRTTSPSTKAAFDKAVFLGQLAAAIRGGTK